MGLLQVQISFSELLCIRHDVAAAQLVPCLWIVYPWEGRVACEISM